MAQDVVITPASGKMEFFQDVGGSAVANIQLDSSTSDLSLSTTAGNLIIGDASRDVYIGDGINSVDIVFEQNGEIRGLTNKTLTLGQSDSIVNFNTSKTIFSAGNVGIGTANPSNILHIEKTQNAGLITLLKNADTGTSQYVEFRLVNQTNSSELRLGSSYNFSSVEWNQSWIYSVGRNLALKTDGSNAIRFYTGGTSDAFERMRINSSGNVGIGTSTPSYKLDVNGTIHYTTLTASSDQRFKKNVEEIDNALNKISNVRGVRFEWNEFINSRRNGYELNKPTFGVIAQELESQFPELVTHWSLSPDCQDARSVNYEKIIPILIEAIKELKEKNENLENRISILENR